VRIVRTQRDAIQVLGISDEEQLNDTGKKEIKHARHTRSQKGQLT
jgi:hypothetical protein